MSARLRRLGWIPPLLVGASTAIAAEVALGMLLYAGPGLVRSLTTVLAVEVAALGGGLWTAARPGTDGIDRLRKKWLLCLFSFSIATIYGVAWSVSQDVGEGPISQGLGLALLAGFPLYTSGVVLGGMASLSTSQNDGRWQASLATLGAALGFMITGLLLTRVPMPASLLIGCLVLLSAGGRIYGIVLGQETQVHIRAARVLKGGDVRVEDRWVTELELRVRYLLEDGHVRQRMIVTGEGVLPWDILIGKTLMPEEDGSWRVLLVGGGVSAFPRMLREERGTSMIEVLERTSAVVELGRDHFDTELRSGSTERESVRIGNLEDLLADLQGPFDLVLVDTSALAPLGGTSALSKLAHTKLLSVLGASGVIAWGPIAPDQGTLEALEGWHQVTFTRSCDSEEEIVVLSQLSGVDLMDISFSGLQPISDVTDQP